MRLLLIGLGRNNEMFADDWEFVQDKQMAGIFRRYVSDPQLLSRILEGIRLFDRCSMVFLRCRFL